MRRRKKPLGDQNSVGACVTQLREERGMKQKDLLAKMQVAGVDIDPSSLSKLEGQTRIVNDKELMALSTIFGVPLDSLYPKQKDDS